MKKIKNHIYYENNFTGATVGALLFSSDTVLIDAPLKPEDSRAWLSDLHKAGAKPRRLAINLDSHPDRTLGTQALDAQVLAHRETIRQFRRRAAIFKALKQESGAEWEETPGLSGLRWVLPRITFTDHTLLYFDDRELRLELHPGPGPGACWLVSPMDKVVFVGDAVVIGEPPFLGQADIPAWLKQLDVLSSRTFKGFTIIAGRGGKATSKDIAAMRRFLKTVEDKLRRLAKRKSAAAEIDKLAPKLADKFKAPAKRKLLYVQRLKYGMQNYFTRRYHPAKARTN
ncbi:MAG: MBL fold metallo-hydrolase [Chloroflexi bacterium]|nr:MBL fold metallo-hydrolase [Chloroflexota bacterium]